MALDPDRARGRLVHEGTLFLLLAVLRWPIRPQARAVLVLSRAAAVARLGRRFSRNPCKIGQNAPVAQWIEQRFPKPRAHVRFMPGALTLQVVELLAQKRQARCV